MRKLGLWAAVAMSVFVALALLGPSVAAAQCQAPTSASDTPQAFFHYDVPSGCPALKLQAFGGFGASGDPGGPGGEPSWVVVYERVAASCGSDAACVSPGEQLGGGVGSNANGSTGGSSIFGRPAGGNGGAGDAGGGGAASVVYGPQSVLVVAGAGGGGGGAGSEGGSMTQSFAGPPGGNAGYPAGTAGSAGSAGCGTATGGGGGGGATQTAPGAGGTEGAGSTDGSGGAAGTGSAAGSSETGGTGGGGATGYTGGDGGGGGSGYLPAGGGGGGGGFTSPPQSVAFHCVAPGGGGGGGSDFVTPGAPYYSATLDQIAVNPEVDFIPVGAPTATVSSPNDTVGRGTDVSVSFSCAEGSNGPGLSTCNGAHSSAPGQDTLSSSQTFTAPRAGSYTYTVTATSLDGATGTATFKYVVVALGALNPKNLVVCATSSCIAAQFQISVPAPGSVSVTQAGGLTHARLVAARSRAPKLLVRATKVQVRKAGKVTIKLRLTAAGRRELAKTGKLRVRLKITYRPRGTTNSISRTVTVTFKRRAKARR